MNTKLNIKARQLFSPTFVTLLIGIVMVLVLGSPSVQAQTATTTTTDTTSTAPVDSTITLPVSGSVSDPNGPVTVNGDAIVAARTVVDNTSTTTTKIVLLDFDFSQLKGTSGSAKTGTKTYVTGENLVSEIRPFLESDTIIVSAPYYDSTKGPLSARTMLVTATLKFDTTTGKVVSGSITVGNNVVTSAAVSTTVQPMTIQQ